MTRGCGGGSRGSQFRRGEPRAWWGRAEKRCGHLVVQISSVWGCCDAGDVIDGPVVHHQHHEELRRPCKLLLLLGVGVHVNDRA